MDKGAFGVDRPGENIEEEGVMAFESLWMISWKESKNNWEIAALIRPHGNWEAKNQ